MNSVKRFKTDYASSSVGVFGSGGVTLANGSLEIAAGGNNQSGINLHAKNPNPGLDCTLLCVNGTAGQQYTSDFAIISKTLNVVGSNTQNNTSATINMYGATATIGSPDAQIICSGGNSSAVNNGNLSINANNFSLSSTGVVSVRNLFSVYPFWATTGLQWPAYSVTNTGQNMFWASSSSVGYPIAVRNNSNVEVMNIYKDGTINCLRMWIQPNAGVSTMCMNSTNNAFGTPDSNIPDFSMTCAGGTEGTANKGNVTLSAGTITLNGNVKLPSTYTSAPADATYLGYLKEVKNTTALTMNATSTTVLCSITLTAGVWIVTGVACFFPTTTSTFVQAAISSTSVFDDFSQVTQFISNSNGCLINVPMKYYSGSGTTLNLVALCSGSTANANTTNFPSTLRAVRIA